MTATVKRPPARKGTGKRPPAKRVGANGSSANGAVRAPEEFVGFPPPELTTAREDVPPPEEFVPTTTPVPPAPQVPAHPYKHDDGTPYTAAEVYVFTPEPGGKAGDEPIVFPHITTVRPSYHFMWKLRKLDQIQQSFEWMDMAKVPDAIQERVTLLSDGEQARFFMGWFTPAVSPQMQVGVPGES